MFQPTNDCPHQFGYYEMEDRSNCGRYKNCDEGRAFYMVCTQGLAFNKRTNQCDWPDMVPECDAEAYLDFICPTERSRENKYKGHSCGTFFLCINDKPRLLECSQGDAFHQDSQKCVKANQVPGC